MSYLFKLPIELYSKIYKNVFNETLKELESLIFEFKNIKIDFTVRRCNHIKNNNDRCKKKFRTRYLLNKNCKYHLRLYNDFE